MFDIGAAELLVIVIVAILVIGPKDMPMAMRTAGRWIGKLRRMSNHFRSGIDTMIREAELEDAEKEWKARNERIMSGREGADVMKPLDPPPVEAPRPVSADDAESRAEAAIERAAPNKAREHGGEATAEPEPDPELPLPAPPTPPSGARDDT